jgi:hypothetical protein
MPHIVSHGYAYRENKAHFSLHVTFRLPGHRAVEPENRLVTRTLEREWHETLGHLEHLEWEYTA